jgi:ABC-type phosphate transport system ATPase subunit
VGERLALLIAGELVETLPAAEFFESTADPRTRAFVRGELGA